MALSANRTNVRERISGRDIALAIKSGAIIFDGAMVCVDNTGALPALATTASLRWAGVAIRGNADKDGNATDDTNIVVRRRGTYSFKKTGATASDLLKLAYAVDDEEVTVAAPGNAYIVGRIVAIIDSSTVEVDLEDRVA
jgi:hypothetical protein